MVEIITRISGITREQTERRAEILETINEELTLDELEKLLSIAKSKTAKSYLSNPLKWGMLKGFLKL